MQLDPYAADLTELGIKLPDGVAEAQQAYTRVYQLANNDGLCDVGPRSTTPETVEADMLRAAQARLVRDYAREVVRDFDRHATVAVRELYQAAAPRILKDLARVVVKPLKVITEAARHIGPDDDGSSVIERDQAAVDTWRRRGEIERAAETLRTIQHKAATFAAIAAKAPFPDVDPVLWWIDVDDHNHLARIKAGEWAADGPGGGYLALAHAGYTLRLATPEQAQARQASVRAAAHREATLQQRQMEEAEAARNRAEGAREVRAQEALIRRG